MSGDTKVRFGVVAPTTALVAAVMTLALGCGGSGGGGGSAALSYACDVTTATSHTCTTYSYSSPSMKVPGGTLQTGQRACTTGGGTLPTSCAAAGLLAACTLTKLGDGYNVDVTLGYYADAGGNGQLTCAAGGGSWTIVGAVDGGASDDAGATADGGGACSRTGFVSSASTTTYGLDDELQKSKWVFEGQDGVAAPNNRVDVENWVAFGGHDVPGTYAITAAETDYSTCGFCLVIHQDCTGTSTCAKTFMPTGQGAFTLGALGTTDGAHFAGSLEGVVMQEVTIAKDTLVTTPVPDGETWCLDGWSWDGTVTGA